MSQIQQIPTCQIFPSPENDELYHPVDRRHPDFLGMVESIRVNGVKEPLVLTLDHYILSGHRRHAGAEEAGLPTVPCRFEPFRREDDPDRFMRLLREYNRQRVKTLDEQMREAVLDTNPEEEYRALVEHREQVDNPAEAPLVIEGRTVRSEITKAKAPFLAAIRAVLDERRKFWPLSDRQIHYALLNNPPLRHASKPSSVYRNDGPSYKSLTDLLTRARLEGLIPMHAIGDETRPQITWQTDRHAGTFFQRELDNFLKGYRRDLMQSQPDHVEIVGEKNTVLSALKPVAARFTIPLTIGRGYCSLPPRNAIAERYRRSGKRKLVLLILSDFDPDGEEICHSFIRSMRDEFFVPDVHAVKVSLTAEQVKTYGLPRGLQAKESSTHHAKFTAKHGHDVFELEALPPVELQRLLAAAIDRVIDVGKFNAELDAERRDAGDLAAARRVAWETLKTLKVGGPP